MSIMHRRARHVGTAVEMKHMARGPRGRGGDALKCEPAGLHVRQTRVGGWVRDQSLHFAHIAAPVIDIEMGCPMLEKDPSGDAHQFGAHAHKRPSPPMAFGKRIRSTSPEGRSTRRPSSISMMRSAKGTMRGSWVTTSTACLR